MKLLISLISLSLVTSLVVGCGLVRPTGKAAAPETVVAEPLGSMDPLVTTSSGAEAPPIVTEAAVVKPAATAGPLETVAGLGDPSRPGLWLETPMVAEAGSGRVVLKSSGAEVAVQLLPAIGEVTAGSRLSLEAMRALGAPLTELVELTIYPGG